MSDGAVIHNQAMIANNLSLLQKEKVMISGALGGKNVLLTAVMDIDIKKNVIFLDTGSSEILNKIAVNTKRIQFNCIFNGVKVSFNLEKLTRGRYKGYDTFTAEFPSSLYWFDRRNAFRVRVPYSSSSVCKFTIPPADEQSTLEYRQSFENVTNRIREKLINKIEKDLLDEKKAFERAYLRMSVEEKIKAKLEREQLEKERAENPPVPDENLLNIIELSFVDLSMTGCALISHSREYSPFLTPSTKYENCTLVFMEQGKDDFVAREINVNVEVMMQRELEEHSDKMFDYHELIGIKFLEPSQKAESVIFRYIQAMDRIAKNRRDF
jgi:c-di-GMP-binding flagellar brake protein YcgR